jgi:hypothetical protein
MGNPHRVPFSAALRMIPAAAPSVSFISQKVETAMAVLSMSALVLESQLAIIGK